MDRGIENSIQQFIEQNQLIQQGDLLVIGVSGGADSMMLLHFLNKYRDYYHIKLQVAHINHGIRKEAAEDEAHVRQYCEHLQIPCHIHHCDIKQIAKAKGISEEDAGRRERYSFFYQLAGSKGKIVTAHNQNDQAETVLMYFLRGADIKGLGGILPKRGQIIRPILGLSREQIEAYCKVHHIVYKQDHTNFLPIYTRNKIRLECIPYIKEHINPGIVSALAEKATIYQESEGFLESYTEAVFKKVVQQENKSFKIDCIALKQEATYIQKRLIYFVLAKCAGTQKDITTKHVNACIDLLEGQSGRGVNLPYQISAQKIYDFLMIGQVNQGLALNLEAEEEKVYYSLKMGINIIENFGLKIICTLKENKIFEQSMENMYTKYIDYDKIQTGLTIRTRRPQDFIVTQVGHKKLKKYFSDEKIPKDIRNQIPLLVDDQEVVWVIGKRLNARYHISEDTIRVLEIVVAKI